MRVSALIVRASSLLVDPRHRATLHETWTADLHYARDAGIAPIEVAAGAFLTAVSPHNLRRALERAAKRRSTFVSPVSNKHVRVAAWGLWLLVALALLNAGAQAWPGPGGNDQGIAIAGGYLLLGPVLVVAAAIAIGVGVAAVAITVFSGKPGDLNSVRE